jgi:acyl-CoA synthetase (AMP-forming)/AMP-acid ligase II
MPNSIEQVESRFAIAKCGLTMIRLNARDAMETQRYILQHSETIAIFVGEEFKSGLKEIKKRLPRLQYYIALSGHDEDFIDYETLLSTQPDHEPDVEVNPRDLDNIRYTSGTTGRPKGAMTTYRAMQARLQNFFMNLDMVITPDDICLSVAPLTHAAGNIFMPYYFVGAKNIILKGFDERSVLETMQKEKITAILLVPTMINRLIEYPHVQDYDTSSLKRIFYGTSPISPEKLKKALQIFGPIFRQNYGMAEAMMPLICLHPQDHVTQGKDVNLKRLSSVGRPALGVEIRVVDKKRREVAPGEIGEIIVRSENMMKGYWKNKKETAKILKNGWLHTGDLATVDDEGFIYIMDRKKDMIISGGFNIYPKEIENLIYSHPDVKEVAVIGIPDDEWGESVKAFIVSHEGRTIDEDEITELCRNRLASYKKPKYIDIVKDLPKNAVGKIMKDKLRKKEWVGYERMVH